MDQGNLKVASVTSHAHNVEKTQSREKHIAHVKQNTQEQQGKKRIAHQIVTVSIYYFLLSKSIYYLLSTVKFIIMVFMQIFIIWASYKLLSCYLSCLFSEKKNFIEKKLSKY